MNEDAGCCARNDSEPHVARCPKSGSAGRPVGLQTIKALLTERALARLEPGDYRFCDDAQCDVVYFSGAGSQFDIEDLRVPVWHKQPAGSRMVCYCFGESEASIGAEIESTGRSFAVERVRQHIAAGRCACELRNPRGTCCLGDLMAAVRRAESISTPHAASALVTGLTDVS